MSISSELNRVTYTGNGATTAFAISFPFHAAADLVVVETIIATGVQTTKTLTTHYTVSGTTDDLGYYPNGGTVTAVTAPASTVTWTIYRDPDLVQSLNLSENNALPAESLEAQLDYLTMLVQRLKDRVDRSMRQPEGDSANIGLIPSKVDRASKYSAFDANGDPIATAGTTSAYVVTPFMETVLDDTTAAAARATLGAITDTSEDSRTNTVAVANIFVATTTGTPAAGIGTGAKFRAESADESPSDVGQYEFAFSDVSAGSEDSYFQILLRRAGAALAAAWKWTATGTFNAILAHANTADRTYTFPDATTTVVGTDTAQTLTNKTVSGGCIVTGTLQATTSGTAIDYTSIPSWAKCIIVQFNVVSLSGTADLRVQIGDSGGVETAGYSGRFGFLTNDISATTAVNSSGFDITSSSAASTASGTMILTLMDASTNLWTSSHAMGSASAVFIGGGVKALTATLDRVRITTSNGTDTFDAGSVNISYMG